MGPYVPDPGCAVVLPNQALFRRAQLKALVDIHSEASGLGGGYLSTEEIAIIRGALDMTEKKAFVGMTPLDKVRAAQWPATHGECPLFQGQPRGGTFDADSLVSLL